jgi:hypothetical protein
MIKNNAASLRGGGVFLFGGYPGGFPREIGRIFRVAAVRDLLDISLGL